MDIKSKKIIIVNEELVKNKLGEVVRETVGETLNSYITLPIIHFKYADSGQ
jgi:hypothetical protein